MNPDIYLQGSYRNATNIFGDSDVDIVVELRSSFNSDVMALDAAQRELQRIAYQPATYLWINFRGDVLRTLQDYYGSARVEEADKCIKVSFGPGRIAADVVSALQHRKYSYFYSEAVQAHADGVQFQNLAGISIVNFPKQHISNGESKNAPHRTNGWYKPSVRMFKNARNRLVRDNLITENSCPSYCVECLIYNADDSCFGGTYQETFARVVEYLGRLNPDACICQNGVAPLFGTSPVQWNVADAGQFLTALQDIWLNWE